MGAGGIIKERCNGGGIVYFVWGLPEKCIQCEELAGCVTVLATKCIKCLVVDRCTLESREHRELCKGPYTKMRRRERSHGNNEGY